MDTIPAAKLAEIRHLLVSDIRSCADPSALLTPEAGPSLVAAYMLTSHLPQLTTADLYTVAPDACVLTAAAAADLPATYRPSWEDLPARSGLLAWETPLVALPEPGGPDIPVLAASWHTTTGPRGAAGVAFAYYTATTSAWRPRPGWSAPLAPARMGTIILGDGTPSQPWQVQDAAVEIGRAHV